MKKPNTNSVLKRFIDDIKTVGIIVPIIILLIFYITWYLILPAFNWHDITFYIWIELSLALSVVLYFGIGMLQNSNYRSWAFLNMATRTIWLQVGIFIAVFTVWLAGSKLFHAYDFANVLSIENGNIETDIPTDTKNITLMDTKSARQLGNRVLGYMTDTISLFEDDPDYSQIAYKGESAKVTNLKYASFFRWLNNRNSGIPGYIYINTNTEQEDAEYKKLESGMKVSPSGRFGDDLNRFIRKQYPSLKFGNVHFEIDDNDNPYYIASVYNYKTSFGCKYVIGILVVNPITRDIKYYNLSEIPDWVDVAVSGDLICEQYDWYGELSGGFINSIFGKKNCTITTRYKESGDEDTNDDRPAQDYGYFIKDGHVWIYTGITSVISNDKSDKGFIMADERTGKAYIYEIPGANEQSAMQAAEGEVQQYGYQASFPSLIKLDNTLTFMMALKDNNGIVKMYGAVNLEQYNKVAVGETLKDCINNYGRKLGKETDKENKEENKEENLVDMPEENSNNGLNVNESEELNNFTPISIKIDKIERITIDGDSYICFHDETTKKWYKMSLANNLDAIYLNVGDTLDTETNSDGYLKGLEN